MADWFSYPLDRQRKDSTRVASGLTPSTIAERIRNPGFSSVRRGFDPNQVSEYLSKVADRVQALESQTHRLESELAEARRQTGWTAEDQTPASPAPYGSASARVADLIRAFDQDVQRLRGEAEAEAERVVAEARSEADGILLEAQNRARQESAAAEQALQKARAEAKRTLSGLTSLLEGLTGEVNAIRDDLLDTDDPSEPIEEVPLVDKGLIAGFGSRDNVSDGGRIDGMRR